MIIELRVIFMPCYICIVCLLGYFYRADYFCVLIFKDKILLQSVRKEETVRPPLLIFCVMIFISPCEMK